MSQITGREAFEKIAKVLGLEGRPICRMIVDIELDSAVTVLVDEFITPDKFDDLVNVLLGLKEGEVNVLVKDNSELGVACKTCGKIKGMHYVRDGDPYYYCQDDTTGFIFEPKEK